MEQSGSRPVADRRSSGKRDRIPWGGYDFHAEVYDQGPDDRSGDLGYIRHRLDDWSRFVLGWHWSRTYHTDRTNCTAQQA
jgi:hypothetical protein